MSALLAAVRRQWGAGELASADLAQVALWWGPPTHMSKEILRLTDGQETVAHWASGTWASFAGTAEDRGPRTPTKERRLFLWF